MYLEPPFIMLSTAGLWQIFRRRSSGGLNRIRSLGVSTRRKTMRQLPPGGWTWRRLFRSSTCVLPLRRWPLLTSHSQKALTTTTDPAVLAVRHDVTNTDTVVSGAQNDSVNTPTMVCDGHRSTPKIPKDTRGQNRMVSTLLILSLVE